METLYSFIVIFLLIGIIGLFIVFRNPRRKPPASILLILLDIGVFIQYIGISYQSNDPGEIIFVRSVFNAIKMISADFRYDQFGVLMQANRVYFIANIMTHILVLFYTIYFFISLVGFKLFNLIKITVARFREHYVLVGSVDNMSAFLKSVKSKIPITLIIEDHSKSDEDWIEFFRTMNKQPNLSFIFREFQTVTLYRLTRYRLRNKSVHLIALYEDELKNVQAINMIKQSILGFKHELKRLRTNIRGYALYQAYEMASFMQSIKETKGQIQLFNTFDLIAKSFVQRYPLTDLIPKEYILPNGELKQEKYQYHFIGFGKINQEILKKVIMNNPFLSTPIDYFIYARNADQAKRRFMKPLRAYHDTNDHRLELPEKYHNQEIYLPPIDSLGNIHFDSVDIDTLDFMKQLKQRITPKGDVNILIVSLGDSLLNARVCREIRTYLNDEKIQKNAYVFMQTKSLEYYDEMIDLETSITPFGDLESTLSIDNIIDKKIDNLAIAMHESYRSKNYQMPSFYDLPFEKQQSNRYAALHIRTKLHLLGLDFAYGKNHTNWQELYRSKIKTPAIQSHKTVKDLRKTYLKTPLTARDIIARIEHQRWNTYHVMKGWVPMPKATFIDHLHNNKPRPTQNNTHEHICLTSFEGLVELAEMIKQEKPDFEIDYLQYDYLLMDQLIDYLEHHNNTIAKRPEEMITIKEH